MRSTCEQTSRVREETAVESAQQRAYSTNCRVRISEPDLLVRHVAHAIEHRQAVGVRDLAVLLRLVSHVERGGELAYGIVASGEQCPARGMEAGLCGPFGKSARRVTPGIE